MCTPKRTSNSIDRSRVDVAFSFWHAFVPEHLLFTLFQHYTYSQKRSLFCSIFGHRGRSKKNIRRFLLFEQTIMGFSTNVLRLFMPFKVSFFNFLRFYDQYSVGKKRQKQRLWEGVLRIDFKPKTGYHDNPEHASNLLYQW